MAVYKSTEPLNLNAEGLGQLVAPVAQKYAWFVSKGYVPHTWQTLFHSMTDDEDHLTRFRYLAAGRRGGKTLSAAWEVLFYCLFPQVFHQHAHGTESNRRLWIWVLTKDYKAGTPALYAFREVLEQAGLVHGVDYKENRGNRYFEFDNALVEFKTADDPESLRGAGLDMLWLDEAAFIPTDHAWKVVRPALSDKLGLVIATTTPDGKNWFWEKFVAPEIVSRKANGGVEYYSIDNPYFPEEEWEEAKQTMHPMVFKREYMASFDAFEGIELQGDWLHYYRNEDLPRSDDEEGKLNLRTYIGVDPAISLSENADRFVMTLIGVAPSGDTYLLEQYADRIPFPEQIEMIRQWNLKYKPMAVGIENTAYQAALLQQIARLSDMVPIIPQPAKGKKSERILSMSPAFRTGKVKIRSNHTDFIDEWINYNSALKAPKDDCLDSMEIALRTAGVLLPERMSESLLNDDYDDDSWEAVRARDFASLGRKSQGVDEHMGEW